MNFTHNEVREEICKILATMREEPKFTIEDEAQAIHERLFVPYQKFLFFNFSISQEAYERKHC